MKKINKQLNLLINYTENLYKISEIESLCIIFTKCFVETKNESFFEHEHKN